MPLRGDSYRMALRGRLPQHPPWDVLSGNGRLFIPCLPWFPLSHDIPSAVRLRLQLRGRAGGAQNFFSKLCFPSCFWTVFSHTFCVPEDPASLTLARDVMETKSKTSLAEVTAG